MNEVRDRELHVVAAAIGISAVGDWVALVALALQAKELSGEGMGGGIAIAGIFICAWRRARSCWSSRAPRQP
jgi:hypothetical protein